jgi:ankyrin repeat protein
MDHTDDFSGLTFEDFLNSLDDEELATDADGRGSEPVLHEMAREGKIGVLKEALEVGGDLTEELTEENDEGQAPIEAAAAGGSAEAIRLLLDEGADPTEREHGGRRALLLAVRSGTTEAAEHLLNAGVELNAGTEVGSDTEEGESSEARIGQSNLVFAAAESGPVGTLRLLLEEGARADATSDLGRTPLHLTAEESEAKTRLLLKAGATVDHVDDYGRTPLSFAAGGGQPGALRALLSRGADPTRTDPSGDTPLHHAVCRDKEAPLRILIDHGADVDKPNEWGETPLHKAAEIAHFGPAQVLLEAGADPLAENNDGELPTQVDPVALPSKADEINTLIRSYVET